VSTKTAHNCYYIYSLIPEPVRRELRLRIPCEADEVNRKGMLCRFGDDHPVRWLYIGPTDSGLLVEVHELRKQGTKILGATEVTADRLVPTLQRIPKVLSVTTTNKLGGSGALKGSPKGEICP